MPRLVAAVSSAPSVSPALARSLWQWLTLGLLATIFLPAARGVSDAAGPWSFWLLLAPLISLAMLYRRVIAAAWQDRTQSRAAARTRSPRQSGKQARRLLRVRSKRQQPQRAA